MIERVVDRKFTARQTGYVNGVPIKTYLLSSSKDFDAIKLIKNHFYLDGDFYMKRSDDTTLVCFVRGKNGKEFADITEIEKMSSINSNISYHSVTNGRKVAPRDILPVEKKIFDIENSYRRYLLMSATSSRCASEEFYSTWPRLPDQIVEESSPLFGKTRKVVNVELTR